MMKMDKTKFNKNVHKLRSPRFHTYECVFMIKFKKQFNQNEMVERIRGIKNVTIVKIENTDRYEDLSKRSKDYTWDLVHIKFNTNKKPEDEIEDIKYALLRADKNKEIYNIIGIVGAKEKKETLNKID